MIILNTFSKTKSCGYDLALKFLLEIQITLQESGTFSHQKELISFYKIATLSLTNGLFEERQPYYK